MPTIRSLGEIPTSEDVGLDTLEAPSSLHILSDVSRNDTSLDEHLERDQLGNTINSQMTYTLRPTIIIYPTVPPQTVIIPILCSIVIFPIVAAAAICLLRYYNQRARAKDRFRAGFQQGASAMFAMGRIGATSQVGQKNQADPPKSEVSRFRAGMPELELDTVFDAGEILDDELSSQPPSASSQGQNAIDDPLVEVKEGKIEEVGGPYLAIPPHPKSIVKAPKEALKMVENKSFSVAI